MGYKENKREMTISNHQGRYLPYAYSPESMHYTNIKAAEIKLGIKGPYFGLIYKSAYHTVSGATFIAIRTGCEERIWRYYPADKINSTP